MKKKLRAALLTATVLLSANTKAQTEVKTDGGLEVSNGDYSLRIGGRLQYDYNRSELNGDVDEDQFDSRRARLYVSGTVSKDWAYKLQFNLDGSGFEDLYISYKGFGEAANVTIGNQREPFGLQDQTSSNDIVILERSALMELFAPGRNEGILVHGDLGNNIHYGVGGFFDDVNDDEAGEEFGYAGRVAWAPVKTDTSLVHLGFAYFDDSEDDGFGVEAAAVFGPFHIQAEYGDGTFDNVDRDGIYIQAGYILSGETRPYSGGKFGRVTPKDNAGAWEVVARYEDGDGDYSDIALGDTDATSYTLGVNYYLNSKTRVGVNYTDGESNIINTDTGEFDDGNDFRVRFALAF